MSLNVEWSPSIPNAEDRVQAIINQAYTGPRHTADSTPYLLWCALQHRVVAHEIVNVRDRRQRCWLLLLLLHLLHLLHLLRLRLRLLQCI